MAKNNKEENTSAQSGRSEADGKSSGKIDPPAQETGVKQLYRSTSNRMIGGICGGLGDYFNIDATLIRILMVILAVSGPGIPAYIIGWIIIPEGRSEDSVTSTQRSSTPLLGLIFGSILIIFGMSLLFRKMFHWFYMPPWLLPLISLQTIFALLLICLGVFFILHMLKGRDDEEIIPSETKSARGSLYRSSVNKKLAGVCGGLGEQFDIDPTIVRVLWAVVTIMTGLWPGLLFYIVLAIVVPERPLIREDIK